MLLARSWVWWLLDVSIKCREGLAFIHMDITYIHGGFRKLGCLFWGPYNKDPTI